MKLDDDTRVTLERLERVPDEDLSRVHRRSASLLEYLCAAGYVEVFGPVDSARMRITDVGHDALKAHRAH